MMNRLHFTIEGFTERDRKEWESRIHPSFNKPKILLLSLVVVGVIYTVVPVNLRSMIRANNVLIITDNSASMTGTELTLERQLFYLRKNGNISEELEAVGFGVSLTADSRNLLNQIRTALNLNSDIDAIYAFSDFEVVNESYWISDTNGYEELRRLLRESEARLYLGTVRYMPVPELISIARESGGKVISAR